MFLSTVLAVIALDRRGAKLLLQPCSSANSFKFWSEYRMIYCWQWYYHHVSYRGKFLLVQIFAKKCPDSSEEIFAVFIFVDAGRSGHTPTSWWPRLVCKPKNTEWRSEEASLCNNGPIFLLCWGFHNNEGIKTTAVGEKLAHWIQHWWSRFQQLHSVSYGFVGILYSSRLPFLYSVHLEGWQTVENHLIHIGISTYVRNDIINFHLSEFIVVFIFVEAGPWKSRKFPTIRYMYKWHVMYVKYWSRWDILIGFCQV